ncbi:hypothetical protein [Actinomadura sp. DC4]|uniref:hypothetical protein n=1 Tax=Actinomadura sp. DC4 TaxID=3055069 RepID=UPI0025B232F9|nr:hypothetical protein [Actinomadura sp. DC4]MDN3358831.1 hypothetical protein [Actinomadura sp. DC4]
MSEDHEPSPRSWRRPGSGFVTRVVTVAAGCSRAYDASEWRDAIVVVECGEVELESAAGVRRSFGSGAILWLDELPLRALNNRGTGPAVLVAVSRRPPPGEDSHPSPGPRPPSM